MRSPVGEAVKAFAEGRPVLLFDSEGREGETDLVIGSQFMNPSLVRQMRRDAGGLICTTLPQTVAVSLGLPLLEEALRNLQAAYPLLGDLARGRPPYDARSSFSVAVNHRQTFTGITDRDRALTIAGLAHLCGEALFDGEGRARQAFAREFRSPGHVPILIADEPLLAARRGHTELSTALAAMARVTPSATLCEMLGDDGGALAKSEAKVYAQERNLVFVQGRDVVEAWRKWSGSWLPESLISST